MYYNYYSNRSIYNIYETRCKILKNIELLKEVNIELPKETLDSIMSDLNDLVTVSKYTSKNSLSNISINYITDSYVSYKKTQTLDYYGCNDILHLEIINKLKNKFSTLLSIYLEKVFKIDLEYFRFILDYIKNSEIMCNCALLIDDYLLNFEDIKDAISYYLQQRSIDIFGEPLSETGFVML